MEVSGRHTENDDKVTIRHACLRLHEDGVTHKAHGYCRNCKEYLCEMCYKCHRRSETFKNHVLDNEDLEKYDSKEDFDDSPPPVPERRKIFDLKCHFHRHEDLKYHCRVHDKIVCCECVRKQHKGCKTVDYIPSICDSENKLLVEKIEYVEEKIKYKLEQERDALQHAEESYESALSALKTQREHVNRYFQETEKCFSDKILSFREKHKNREKDMLEMKQKLIESKKEAMTTMALGFEAEKYLLMHKTEKVVDTVNGKLSSVLGHQSLTLSYKPQEPLPEFGEVIVEEQQGDVYASKSELLKKVNIAGGKMYCAINDIAIFSDSRVFLILTDWVNERLVIILQTYDVDLFQCSAKPFGIAKISDTEIAVSFPNDYHVRFFTVRQYAIWNSIKKSFKVSNKPSGIRYHKSERSLIIAARTQLESWSLDGVLLRTIASYEHNISNLTLTHDGNVLFSSRNKHILCLIKPDGTELKLHKYMDTNMLGPFGIASDTNENIYVCGDCCLHVVSKEGKWEQIIAQEDGFAPQAVMVCDKSNRLLVGQGKGQKYTELLVFRL